MPDANAAKQDAVDGLMTPSGAAGGGFVLALRAAIAKIERKGAILEDGADFLPVGITDLDTTLGGGLAQGALHEIAAASEAEIAAATAFALALAAQHTGGRTVLWIAEDTAGAESGRPYGPGLDEIGLAPERLVLVTAARPRDVLWAMEEALRCRTIAAVIGEVRGDRDIDDVANRRLSLAATAGGGLAFLLLAHPSGHTSPAVTRWIIGAAASAPTRHGVGPPRLSAQLVRNRHGRLGTGMLEWNGVDRCFHLASAHPEPLVTAAADGPDQAVSAA